MCLQFQSLPANSSLLQSKDRTFLLCQPNKNMAHRIPSKWQNWIARKPQRLDQRIGQSSSFQWNFHVHRLEYIHSKLPSKKTVSWKEKDSLLCKRRTDSIHKSDIHLIFIHLPQWTVFFYVGWNLTLGPKIRNVVKWSLEIK